MVEAHCPENSMARHKLKKLRMKSHLYIVLLAACTICIVFALDTDTGKESDHGRKRFTSSAQNDGLHPFPAHVSRRIKGEHKYAPRESPRKPNEMNGLDDREVATGSQLNVERSRELNRKKGSNSNKILNGQSTGGTSIGSTMNSNDGYVVNIGGANGHIRFGGGNKKRGSKTNRTKTRTKESLTDDSPKIDSTTTSVETTSMLATNETPQKMSEVINLNSAMNTGSSSTRKHNSAAADNFLTTFNSKFDAKKKGGKKKKRIGSAGYDLPGIYADTSTSSWGSTGSAPDEWGGTDMKPTGWTKLPDETVHDYKNACPCVYIDAPSWGSSWGGTSSGSSWVGITPLSATTPGAGAGTGAGSTSGLDGSSWGGPSSGSSSVGIAPLSSKAQGTGTEAESTLDREGSWDGPTSGSSSVNVAPFAGMTLNTGTWVGSTSGASGPTSGTKSSKKTTASSSVGIVPLSSKAQGTGIEAESTLDREGSWDGPTSGSSSVNAAPFAGMTLNTGTWIGSTSGAGGPTSGTKSSKKSKVKKTDSKARNLQWDSAHHQPEKILVCTCVPTYFPTYEPT